MSASSFGLFLAPLLPLLLALCWCLPRLREAVCAVTPWAPVPALLLALGGSNGSELQLPWLLLGSFFGLDAINRIFLGFTAMLWIGAGLHAQGHLAGDEKRQRFNLLWLLTMAGNLGLILARDVVSFYAFFTLMSFAAYGLVIHERSTAARRAGRVYLVMAVIGEALILSGLLLAAQWIPSPLMMPVLADIPASVAASRQRELVFACLWLGFGIKTGLPLLHLWLPLAHPVAPLPASVVLSGAMIKAGLLGWMYTLPLGIASMESAGKLLMLTGLFAAFGAAFIGIHQRKAKTVLAYSSISQMGLITVGIGAALHSAPLWPLLAPVLALYALHHALAKGALFLGVGIVRHNKRPLRWCLWGLLALPGLSLVGLGSSGMAAKLGLKELLYMATVSLPESWQWLPHVFAFSALATSLLIARYFWLLHDGGTLKKAEQSAKPEEKISRSEWAGWGLIHACGTLFFLLLPIAQWGGRWPGSSGDLFELMWPAVLGGLLSLAALRLKLHAWKIPAGDVLPWIERLLKLISHAARRVGALAHRRLGSCYERSADCCLRLFRERGLSRRIEHFWRRDAALVFAALMMTFVLLSLLLSR